MSVKLTLPLRCLQLGTEEMRGKEEMGIYFRLYQ